MLFIKGVPIRYEKEFKTASSIYNWMINVKIFSFLSFNFDRSFQIKQ